MLFSRAAVLILMRQDINSAEHLPEAIAHSVSLPVHISCPLSTPKKVDYFKHPVEQLWPRYHLPLRRLRPQL
jgi:hypothetical protein